MPNLYPFKLNQKKETYFSPSIIFKCIINNKNKIQENIGQMNFIDEDFESLEQSPEFFKNNYESDFNPISRRIVFSHALNYMIYARNKIQMNELAGKEGLTDDQFKTMRQIDTSIYLGKTIAKNYVELKNQKGQKQPLDVQDIFKLVRITFSSDLLQIFFVFGIDAIFRLLFSILIIYLFEAVTQGQLSKGYIYCAILAAIWYISLICKQNATKDANVLSSRIKAALAMLLYAKITKLTLYVMKSSEIGKITNLLSSDLGVIQQRLPAFLNALVFPIVLIGSSTLLIVRLGWPGALGMAIVLLVLPISNFISRYNGKLLQEINVYKDRRIKTTTEVIEGIKYIKLYGWEIAFRRIIQQLRQQEILNYKKLSWGHSIERAAGSSLGYFAVVAMFITAHYFSQTQLTIPLIFSTLQVIIGLRIFLRNIVFAFNFYYEIREVFTRFSSIFNIQNIAMIKIDEESKKPLSKQNNQNLGANLMKDELQMVSVRPGQIILKNFNGYWGKDLTTASLKNVNLQFRKCTYYGVTGKVGSGKSGLLGAILGEIPYYSGVIAVGGSVSYVQQQPIIFSMNVRDNIIFGKEFNQTMYEYALHCSCLQSDLQILYAGDQTMVGEKGITLSGGQKARLALARALYADADIYIFDDPISAVDAKVARQINERCLKVLSKRKTVILVTHQIGFLYDCDQVIILDNGMVKSKGSPTLLKEQLEQMSHTLKVDNYQERLQTDIIPLQQQHQMARRSSSLNSFTLPLQQQNDTQVKSFFKQENVTVTFSSYTKFFFSNQQNYLLLPTTIILFLISQGITTLIFRFLAMYMLIKDGRTNIFNQNFNLYWEMLGLLLVLCFFLLVIKYYCLSISILMANENIHEKMINGIVRSPSEFFDVTPSGMLLNKFSSDLGILDNSLSLTIMDMFEGPAATIVAFANICQIDIFFLPPVCIIVPIIIAFFVYSRPVIIQCKQKDLKNRSPIFHCFSQTISGLVQIRTYGRRKSLIHKFTYIINNSSRAFIAFDIVSRGFGFYVTLAGIILMLIGMELGVWKSTPLNAGLYAVTVIFLVQFSEFVQIFLRQAIAVESLMLSSERVFQIINLQAQKDLRNHYDNEIGLQKEVQAADRDEDYHQQWPKIPCIQFYNLSAKYKDGLPRVLKNISFTVQAGQKIGIIGRTGAGKSSIIQAIFRIIEPENGSIYEIGGFDALKMGLHSLRQHISVIPQTPFLFKGTVKQNIDPFTTSDDQVLWKVLQQSGLKKHVQSLPKKLETDISNSSESFSVGQKQLLCLARALLRHNKILVLDEATSNVDMMTDAFIQTVLKEHFHDTTVITIAHRLNTVADYDKIIVMQRGKITEAGSPHQLIQRKGAFYQMVQHTDKNAHLIISKAKSSYQANNVEGKNSKLI